MANVATANPGAWSTWPELVAVVRAPRNLRRTATIALVVGSVFVTMNQLEIVLSGHATAVTWLKVALTYLTPLLVSNLGMLSATRRAAPPAADDTRDQERRGTRNRRRRLGPAIVAATIVVVGAAPALAGTATAGVYRLADGSQVPGAWSTLSTGPLGARMTLQTSDLAAGHTVTVWWVIFNRPERCTHPEGDLRCGPGDLPPYGGDDSAVTSLVYGAGHEVGGSGHATFSGWLATGDAAGALWGPGLVNPTGADIHLLVHDHGMLAPGQRSDGIHAFGPCEPICVDVQYSPHQQ